MEVRRADLATAPEPADAVVVIDVLRSFSTAAYAFAAGARAIYLVDTVERALALRAELPDALTIGAAPGGAPIPEFDLTNSPASLAGRDLSGRELIHCTAGGVRAVIAWQHAPRLLAASLVSARATARGLRRELPERLVLVTTGKWTDRDGDEDLACADYIEALLNDDSVAAAPYEARVRGSDFARRFTGAPGAAHPAGDLECCALADRFDFALRVVRRGGRLLLQPQAA
ncbi:MAG TPA: 2-phosphosulfolactate phosphatase [Burkholderiales bacterium]|nr:2-phosphosulfolactate phosphatase [Burkholderiales bacterium]